MVVWKSSTLKSPPQTDDVEELRNYLKTQMNLMAMMMKELDYALNGNLDIKNLRANSITAKYLNVDELSAITANLGEITAGIIRGIEIYGTTISTNETGYPRAVLSVTDDLFGAYKDANNYVTVQANYAGAPGLYFKSDTNQFFVSASNTETSLDTERRFTITSLDDIRLVPGAGHTVNLYNMDTLEFTIGGTLGSIIGGIYSRLSALEGAMSGKSNVGHTHTVTTTAGGGTFTTSS